MSEEQLPYAATVATDAAQESPPLPPPAPAVLPEEVTALNERIASLAAEIAEAKKATDQQKADLIALQGSHDSAITAYRKLLVSANPLFTEELITGATIPELDASAKKLINHTNKVRAQVEAEIKSFAVPAGAPERSGPDWTILSGSDKIKYAIENEHKAK